MRHTYCTNDYNKLSETFYMRLCGTSDYKTTYTIDDAIKELGDFVSGYKKYEKDRNYWLNFKPFENAKGPKAFANAIHYGEVEHPEKSIYIEGMNTQKNQFIALEKALIRFIATLSEKEQAKIIKKINTRKAKINF